MSNPAKAPPCPPGCDWAEEYYGWRCRRCGAFMAFGCEPWAPDDNDDDDADDWEGEPL